MQKIDTLQEVYTLDDLINKLVPNEPGTTIGNLDQLNSSLLLPKLRALAFVEQIIAAQIAKKIQSDHTTKLDKQTKNGPTNPNLNSEADLVGKIHHGFNNTTRTNEVLTDYVFDEQDKPNPLSSWTFQQAQRLQFQGKSSYEPNYFQVQEAYVRFQIVEEGGKQVVKAKLLTLFTAADRYFYQQYLDAEVNTLLNPAVKVDVMQNIQQLDQVSENDSTATIINNIRDAHRDLYNEDGILATSDFDKIFKNRPRDRMMLLNLIKHAQEKTALGGHNRTFKAMQEAGYLKLDSSSPVLDSGIFTNCWNEVTKQAAKDKRTAKEVMVSSGDEQGTSQTAESFDGEVPDQQQLAEPEVDSRFVSNILARLKEQKFIGEDGVEYPYNAKDLVYYAKYLKRLEAELNKVEHCIAKGIAEKLRTEHKKSYDESIRDKSFFSYSNLAPDANLLEIIQHGAATNTRTHQILMGYINSDVASDLGNSYTFQRALNLNMAGVPSNEYFRGMYPQQSFLKIARAGTEKKPAIACKLPEPFNEADQVIYQQYLKEATKNIFDPKFIHKTIKAEISAEFNAEHEKSKQDEWFTSSSYESGMSFYDKVTHAKKPKFFTGDVSNRFMEVLKDKEFVQNTNQELTNTCSAVFKAEWNMQRALPEDSAQAIIAKIKAKHAQLYQGSGFFKSSTFIELFKQSESQQNDDNHFIEEESSSGMQISPNTNVKVEVIKDYNGQLNSIIAHAQKTGPFGGRNRTFEAMQLLGYLNKYGDPVKPRSRIELDGYVKVDGSSVDDPVDDTESVFVKAWNKVELQRQTNVEQKQNLSDDDGVSWHSALNGK